MTDIEKYNPNHPRQGPLGWLAAQTDRNRENRHALTLREIGRETEIAVAREFQTRIIKSARVHEMVHANIDAKLDLERAHRVSAIVAGENVELQAKCAVLDDDLFQTIRIELHNWNERH